MARHAAVNRRIGGSESLPSCLVDDWCNGNTLGFEPGIVGSSPSSSSW